MFKYSLKDGKLIKTEVASGELTLKKLQDRQYFAPTYSYTRYGVSTVYRGSSYRNNGNSIFEKGLGTKSFLPSLSTEWDKTRRCFIWKSDRSRFEPYDASNVMVNQKGFYVSEFDISTLPDAKNPKQNKRKYVLLTEYCEDALRDCKHWDNKAIEEPTFDFNKDDRLYEYRAWWCIRNLIASAFKQKKRLSPSTLTEMFVKTKYGSKYANANYTFGVYMREFGEELVEYLTAETDNDGKSGIGHPDSDEADQKQKESLNA